MKQFVSFNIIQKTEIDSFSLSFIVYSLLTQKNYNEY